MYLLNMVKIGVLAQLPTYSDTADPLKNISFTSTNIDSAEWYLLQKFAKSWYGLCITIGGAGFVLTLIVAAIGLMTTGRSPRARQEFKDKVLFKVLAFMCLMLAVTFAGIVGNIIKSLVGV